MATPIGHSLAGLGVLFLVTGKKRWLASSVGLVACLAAVVPDLDFLPGLWIGMPSMYHQGISHSFVFAFAAACLAAAFLRVEDWPARRIGPLVFVCYVSHLVLDLGGPDNRLPHGMPLFWPFSQATFLSPVPILLGVSHAERSDSTTLDWLDGILAWQNLLAVSLEVLAVGAVVLVAWRVRESRWPGS